MKKFTKVLALTLVLAMSVLLLASCGTPAKKPSDAVAALKDNGYTAESDSTIQPGIYAVAGVQGVDVVVTGLKKDGDKWESVKILYFKDKDAAKAAWEAVEKDAKEEMKDNEDLVIKKSGAMIYYGTKAAVKAAG